jgi:putative flavoprotein involved in K+ transport
MVLPERTDVLVVGAGQAGVAMSEHLAAQGIPHLVLERGRIAERWRSERWDGLVANGPAWHDRFPNMLHAGDQEAFPPKEAVADYFAAYAEQFKLPIHCGVNVTSVRKAEGRAGFIAETSEGTIAARFIVAATGPFQKPSIPPLVPESADITQMHSTGYRNPQQLPEGGVLVVGAGSSGSQIADELSRSGRKVYLSVGPHGRPPRRYRERDNVWWLGVLGVWELVTPPAGSEHVTIAVSGETIDFRKLAAQGMTLVGRAESFKNGVMQFAPDLAHNIEKGDADYLAWLDRADDYAKRNGLDLPADPEARVIGPRPDCMTHPIASLDLTKAGIKTIIWATGFQTDYSWLKVDTFDAAGKPIHQRGVSQELGVYFLGLPWLARRGSSFIWGVWHDARFIADQIGIQRTYATYRLERNTAT